MGIDERLELVEGAPLNPPYYETVLVHANSCWKVLIREDEHSWTIIKLMCASSEGAGATVVPFTGACGDGVSMEESAMMLIPWQHVGTAQCSCIFHEDDAGRDEGGAADNLGVIDNIQLLVKVLVHLPQTPDRGGGRGDRRQRSGGPSTTPAFLDNFGAVVSPSASFASAVSLWAIATGGLRAEPVPRIQEERSKHSI